MLEMPGGMDDNAANARVGQTLNNKWKLERLLGIGGTAVVYAATHRNGRQVAVKVLHSHLASRDDVRARFLREGYLANRIPHPGVVAVLDDDIDELHGYVFLVMELLRGETLQELWTRRGRLLPDEVLIHTLRVLDVLAAAHDHGVVHRDVKPENIFLTSQPGLKLLDFGIARLKELSGSAGTSTGNGTFIGTPAFMAPEQARARWEQVDARTDVWAMGATMFTLLSGRYPHDGSTATELLVQTATEQPVSVANVAPGLPSPIVEVVDRALRFDRAERFQDVRAMRGAIVEGLSKSLEVSALAISAPWRGIDPSPTQPSAAVGASRTPAAVRLPNAAVPDDEPVMLPLKRSWATKPLAFIACLAALSGAIIWANAHGYRDLRSYLGDNYPFAEGKKEAPANDSSVAAPPLGEPPSVAVEPAPSSTAALPEAGTQGSRRAGATVAPAPDERKRARAKRASAAPGRRGPQGYSWEADPADWKHIAEPDDSPQ